MRCSPILERMVKGGEDTYYLKLTLNLPFDLSLMGTLGKHGGHGRRTSKALHMCMRAYMLLVQTLDCMGRHDFLEKWTVVTSARPLCLNR